MNDEITQADQITNYELLSQDNPQRSHEHKLRKKSHKKYNLNVKLLDIYQQGVQDTNQQSVKEIKNKILKMDESDNLNEIQEEPLLLNDLKFKLNPQQIQDKTQEKVQRKIQQLVQFQIMQQDYINSYQNKKEQQSMDKIQQDQHKNSMLDELVKDRQLFNQRIAEQQPKLTEGTKLKIKVPSPIKLQTENCQVKAPTEISSYNITPTNISSIKLKSDSQLIKIKSELQQIKNNSQVTKPHQKSVIIIKSNQSNPIQKKTQSNDDLMFEKNVHQETIPIKKKHHVVQNSTIIPIINESTSSLQEEKFNLSPPAIKKVIVTQELKILCPTSNQDIKENQIQMEQPPVFEPQIGVWSGNTQNQNLNLILINEITQGEKFKKMSSQIQQHFYDGHHFMNDKATLQVDELTFQQKQIAYLNNQDGFESIEIVNNLNQKVKIKVSSKPQSFNWKKIYDIAGKKAEDHEVPSEREFYSLLKNPLDSSAREENFKSGSFRSNYQSGYAPVGMQQREEEAQQKKTHFIRQKQSQAKLSLKRTCGVSYVKPSESQQLNVNHIFKKLPPLMFQCSSGSEKIEGFDAIYEQLFEQLLNGRYPIICTWLIDEEEETIRDYLLCPEKRLNIAKNKIYLFKELKDFWLVCIDQSTIFIHLQYDHQTLLTGFDYQSNSNLEQQLSDYVQNSEITICLSFKKGLSGRKSFLKSVDLFHLYEKQEKNQGQCDGNENTCIDVPTTQQTRSEHNDTPKKKIICPSQALVDALKKEESHVNLYTCSIRMELVVNQSRWEKSPKIIKSLLTGFIQYTDLKIQSNYLVQMMNKRLKAHEKGIQYLSEKMQKSIGTIELSSVGHQSIFNNEWSSEFKKETLEACVQMKSRFLSLDYKKKLESIAKPLMLESMKRNNVKGCSSKELSYLEHPMYCISTRDSFAYDLIEKVEYVMMQGRRVRKTEYFFDPSNCPNNYAPTFLNLFPDYKVGLVSYDDYFTHEEMNEIEKNIYETEVKAFNNVYLPQTAQIQIGSTVGHVASVRRTKFFFGYRYMWTRCQLAEPNSMVAAGVRRDVSQTPDWMRKLVVNQLENCGIIPKNFVNSIACNVYHDGKEGLAQHFDDAVRFRQPIFTLRAFSDCRLCFGSQFYGFCNGAFAVPLARGCILVMEEESYAANGIKHCVRPCDMTGKSAAVIMRQMHHQVTSEADKFDEIVDFPCQFSTLSIDEDAVPYGEQKRLEGEVLLAHK